MSWRSCGNEVKREREREKKSFVILFFFGIHKLERKIKTGQPAQWSLKSQHTPTHLVRAMQRANIKKSVQLTFCASHRIVVFMSKQDCITWRTMRADRQIFSHARKPRKKIFFSIDFPLNFSLCFVFSFFYYFFFICFIIATVTMDYVSQQLTLLLLYRACKLLFNDF